MRENLYNAILGLAIGDALGVPAEFMGRQSLRITPVNRMMSGGIWGQPAGTWSDDTAMTLATLDAIKENNFVVNDKTLNDIMNNFLKWYKYGKYAVANHRFDIGNTCRKAIDTYRNNEDINNCGCSDAKSCGNGALMRIIPASIFDDDTVLKISRLTHNNKTCDDCSLIYSKFLNLLQVMNKEDAFEELIKYVNKNTNTLDLYRLKLKSFKDLDEIDIKSSGYAVHTLEAAIWCFLNTKSYRDCVLKAVNLGEDTDTVAAVAGGLAGIYYGINDIDGIPSEWIMQLRDKHSLDKICGI